VSDDSDEVQQWLQSAYISVFARDARDANGGGGGGGGDPNKPIDWGDKKPTPGAPGGRTGEQKPAGSTTPAGT
jgi:hypothetical protein